MQAICIYANIIYKQGCMRVIEAIIRASRAPELTCNLYKCVPGRTSRVPLRSLQASLIGIPYA